MIFRRTKENETEPVSTDEQPAVTLFVVAEQSLETEALLSGMREHASGRSVELVDPAQAIARIREAQVVVSVFQDAPTLDRLLDASVAERKRRNDGFPVLVVAAHLSKLTELGLWLFAGAAQDRIEGIRLATAQTQAEIPSLLVEKLTAVHEPNVIKMPVSPEVDCKDFKYYFSITPDLRRLVRTMRELAENKITRLYLLGGPGTGKTSIAYYYFLCRAAGNFVTVNLTAESTGDKEAMKSLLCGHVTGAIAGGGAREGALSYAGNGVAFLDESHGVTGVVMQVLMEVLDSGQFLPFGATKKRSLECAVIFASNRSWEALRDMMNLDEHARLGATIVRITDLAVREEDMIAVLATTLAKFSRQCTTWKPPAGLTPEAWKAYKECRWRGNTRTLIRVTEAAGISFSIQKSPGDLIDLPHVLEGITLWEPAEHESLKVYTSFPSASI